MIAAQRRNIILQELEASGSLVVDAVSRRLHVTPITIRRDFAALARTGNAVRVRGGLVALSSDQAVELPYSIKHTQHLAEKRRIAALAADLIADGQSVILDGGTTTAEIAARLRSKRRLSIITGNVRVLALLGNHASHTVIVPGGILRPGLYELMGATMTDFFQTMHADFAFIGADAVDLQRGVMSASMADPPVKRAMLAAASTGIVVADHSKFGQRALAQVCALRDLTRVLTDSGMDTSVYQELTAAGVVVDRA